MTAATASPVARIATPAAAAGMSDTPSSRRIAALTARVAVGLLLVVALLAIVVHVVAAGPVRGWLGFSFAGVPATLPEAGRIFAHNARAICGVLGLLIVAQLAARRPENPAAAQRWMRATGEALLAGVIGANLAVVGAALGAYGTRMLRAVLPHGPVELAAFAVAIALYLQGRHRILRVAQIAATTATALALLALAALLEAMVTP